MSRIAANFRLALLMALAGSFVVCTGAQARLPSYEAAVSTIRFAELPVEARQTLLLIQSGGPFPFPRRDGATFGNFERRLPTRMRGNYREYAVPMLGSPDRGARPIIAGSLQDEASPAENYYTGDHYRNFRRITQP